MRGPDAAAASASGQAEAGASGGSQAAPSPDRSRHRRWPLVAGAAVVLAGCGVAIGLLAAALGQAHGEIGRLDHLVDQRGIGGAVASALHDPTHELVPLENPEGTGVADVVVARRRGYVLSSDLPTLPVGRTYQLWAETAHGAISLGLLGRQVAEAAFTIGPTRPVAYELTDEPVGGSLRPTGWTVASGRVST